MAYSFTKIRQIKVHIKFWMRYFSIIFGGLSWNVFQWIQIILNILYVFQSVSYLTYLLNICQYRNISSSWYIFLKFFDIFPGYFWNISRLFEFLYVCQSVSPSLISFPICHFWGSTFETSGLVSKLLIKCKNFSSWIV